MALSRGSVLFDQDEVGDRVYILVLGALAGRRSRRGGRREVVGEIGRGEIVGEMAIFTGEPRSARVRALRDSELVSLDRQAFDRLVVRYPQMLMALTRLVIHRLRQAQSGQVQESPARTIAVVAAGPHAPLAAFARCLAAALAELGTTLHLGAADLDRHLGTPGLAQTPLDDPRATGIAAGSTSRRPGIASWSSKRMRTASAWSVHCVHQADRLLVVGRAGDDPTPGAAERRAPRSARGRRRRADQPRHHPPAGDALRSPGRAGGWRAARSCAITTCVPATWRTSRAWRASWPVARSAWR